MLVSFAGLALSGSRFQVLPKAYSTFNVLNDPFVGVALRWRAFRTVAQAGVSALFVFVIVAGLFGQQQAGSNIATLSHVRCSSPSAVPSSTIRIRIAPPETDRIDPGPILGSVHAG